MARRPNGGRFPSVNRALSQIYAEYLEEKQTEGGWSGEFTHEVLRAAKSSPEQFSPDETMNELLSLAAQAYWHSMEARHAPEQPDLFVVAGVTTLPTYTFTDKTVPGGHRRVSNRWAAVRHVQSDADIKVQKGKEVTASGVAAQAAAARIWVEADGDPDVLLWNLRTEPTSPGAGAHAPPPL